MNNNLKSHDMLLLTDLTDQIQIEEDSTGSPYSNVKRSLIPKIKHIDSK